jgi:hypothetical protein
MVVLYHPRGPLISGGCTTFDIFTSEPSPAPSSQVFGWSSAVHGTAPIMALRDDPRPTMLARALQDPRWPKAGATKLSSALEAAPRAAAT